MAITPYSTPTQYQYKPLNLMAFAEPLMKMQEKYDLTKAALEESDVKATALQFAEDPIKARELEKIYRTKRDELITNLMETKNYTQAASKLKQLNKLYQQDPERIALETNYNTFVERDKEEAARVAKGDITPQEYQQWRRDEIAKFEALGGTNYRQDAKSPTGTYNPITGKVGRMINMQKDFDEVKYKAASAMKAKEWDSGLAALGIDPTSQDAKYLKQSFEKLSPQEIDAAVENYMRSLERFKPWLQEKASYDFKDILRANDRGASYNKVASELLQRNYQANEAKIKDLEKQKKTDSDEYKTALENREFLTQQLEKPNQDIIQSLFTQNYMNKQYDAAALGQIFKVNNISSDYSFRDLPKPTGTGSGGDLTLNGASRTSPTSYELVSTDLRGAKSEASRNLRPSLVKVNNIANRNMATLAMGKKGSDQRTQMEKDPALAYNNQKQILAAAQTATTKEQFRSMLYNAGIGVKLDKDVAYAVWNALGGQSEAAKSARQSLNNTLNSMEEDYLKYQDADSQLISATEALLDKNNPSKEFQTAIQNADNSKYVTSAETAMQLAKKWGTTVEKLINQGIIEYTPSSSAKEVYIPEEYRLSGKNIAKAYGFSSVEEAVRKNFNFVHAGSGGITSELDVARDKSYNANYKGQSMGVRIVGDATLDKDLQQSLLNPNELTRYIPVNEKNWANVPGFGEDGKMLSGTKFTEGKPPRIAIRNNTVYLEYSIDYKDEDGKVRSHTLEVVPRKGEEANIEKGLRRTMQLNSSLTSTDKVARATYDDAAVGLYNISSRTNLSEQSGRAAYVDADRPYAILETVPSGSEGVYVQLTKSYNNGNPIYTAFLVDVLGKTPLPIKESSINGLKARVAEQLYYNQ